MDMKLEEFAVQFPMEGEWIISYHDASHLPPLDRRDQTTFASERLGNTVKLGSLIIDDASFMGGIHIVPFTFHLDNKDQLINSFHERWPEDIFKSIDVGHWKNKQTGFQSLLPNYPEIIYGELADTLIRTRIYRPEIDEKDWNAFTDRRNLIFISETSSIRRGIISYLADIFESKPIWVIIPVISMLELQDASGRAKFPLSSKTDSKNFDHLHGRPMSTSSTHELLVLRKRQIPIEFLEVPPELLKYYSGKEHVLRDRLILEGVKRIIREKSTAEKIHLLSGDQDMVRFAKLENIEAVYAGKTHLNGGEQIYSARYDIYKKGFVACGIHEFLWDLTHVFSFIKAESPTTNRIITLDYYFTGRKKNVQDWEEDKIEVTEITPVGSGGRPVSPEEGRNESDAQEGISQARAVEQTA